MIDVNRTVEVLYFRGFIGVTTAAYWEVLAICWPSLTELTKSGVFCLCIWVIVSVSNRAGRQAATVSKSGEKQQSKPRSIVAWLACDVSPPAPGLSARELTKLPAWEPAALWSDRGMLSPANRGLQLLPRGCPGTGGAGGGSKHHLPWADEQPAAILDIWQWRGVLWSVIKITNLAFLLLILRQQELFIQTPLSVALGN